MFEFSGEILSLVGLFLFWGVIIILALWLIRLLFPVTQAPPRRHNQPDPTRPGDDHT